MQGRIFFSERDWQVLFFVVDREGVTRRGSGEGGTRPCLGERASWQRTLSEFSVAGNARPGVGGERSGGVSSDALKGLR